MQIISAYIHSFPNSFALNVYLMSALKVKIEKERNTWLTTLAPKSKPKEDQSIQASAFHPIHIRSFMSASLLQSRERI